MARKLIVAVLAVFFVTCGMASAQAQFGKNRVQYRKLDWKIYYSLHFAVRYHGDLSDPRQYANMQKLVGLLENHYSRYSSEQYFNFEIKEKLHIIVFDSHSDLEGHPMGDPFLPEGVGAFVEWMRVRMVLKQDFEPQLLERIIVHELAHQFQMKLIKRGGFGSLLGMLRIPNGFIEGGAEYLTGVVLPHTRGDIRDDQMRMMGSDIHLMPPWEALRGDRANGYVAWKMVYDFLDAEYGPGTGIKFHVQGFKDDIGLLLYRLSKGKLGNPDINSELFNQEFLNYYNDLYELARAKSPRPYQDTSNFKGRNITPLNHPYPIMSPVLSPDGKRIACFTVQKYGIALVTFPIFEEILYSEKITDRITEKIKYEEQKTGRINGKKVIINLTKQMVPVPYEYLLSPFEVWPKNGTHIAWSKDGRIAFFARTGRDHMLYVIEDKEDGKILQRIALKQDQGFSPSFSPDGKKVYFSASSHATFDIYSVDLETEEVLNLTDDTRYDTAPSVSPDGTRLVYVGNDGDFNHLFMLNLSDLSKKQITFNRYNDSSPSWSDDGKKLVFTSDEVDRIWGMYVLDLENNTRSHWLQFFGRVETPMFARGTDEKVYYGVYRNDDTYHGYVYPNFEVFEAKLKEPLNTKPVVDNGEPNVYAFSSDKFFEHVLDPNQVNNPKSPPGDWMMSASDINLATNTYYGIFASSSVHFENMMKTKQHLFQFATFSSLFRVINYTYVDQTNRMGKAVSVGYNKYPLLYQYYDMSEGRTNSYFLNNVRLQDVNATFMGWYPMSKWTRVEFFSGFRGIKFDLGGLTPEIMALYEDFLPDNEKGLFHIMYDANGNSWESGAAIVRDTVIGSAQAAGPLHGNAFRADVRVAPGFGNLNGYATLSADARVYRKLGAGTLFAGRCEGKTTTRKSGEIIVAGGSDRFRGREWGSIIGNELAYCSAELRFPLVDYLVLPGGMAIGSFRGLFFADAGIAKFHGQEYPAQKITAIGAGIEMKPWQVIWARQPNGKFAPSFYVTFGW